MFWSCAKPISKTDRDAEICSILWQKLIPEDTFLYHLSEISWEPTWQKGQLKWHEDGHKIFSYWFEPKSYMW